MHRGFTIKLFVNLLLIDALIICICGISLPAKAFYEKEKAKISFKIFELKKKEKIEIKKLTKSQQSLENTNQTIEVCEDKLENSKYHLQNLQIKLSTLSSAQAKVAESAGVRIRKIYQGERINVLNLVFSSTDLSTFLDRVYFQKILADKDKNILNNLRARAREINRSKTAVESQKTYIASTLNVMNQKKEELHSSIKSSQFLINKLRTDRNTYEKAQQELEYLSSKLENQIRRSKTTKMIANSDFIKPIVGSITSPFGWRRHPIFGGRRFHTGVDLSGRYGTPIKASNSGKVIYTGWYGGYGKVVIIDHGNMNVGSYKGERFSTLYAHMSSITVGVGSQIKKGQVVGHEGMTGYSTGPHLHFEVRIEGKPNNPARFVRM